MGRIIQPKGAKGSLKWIQHVINECPEVLSNCVIDAIGVDKEKPVEWLSPKAGDDYSEYRDQDFVDLLGIKLTKTKLRDFWPNRGPQWDALGRIEDKAYFLVEAKAHVSEIISYSMAESPSSRSLIKKSLEETGKALKLNPTFDLTKGFYQYSNRLAHLYLLRRLNDIPAYLVFVYFVNDHTHIRTTKGEWKGALQLMNDLLGSYRHALSKYIIDIFVDVQKDFG
jgi:hypothetical protein